MSPFRRRSARLASSTKSPAASQAPRLGSVIEGEESPAEQPTQSLNAVMSSPTPKPITPAATTPVKLPMSEMHPSKVHQTMAPPSSGLRFGFIDLKKADDRGRDQPLAATQVTPSKTPFPASPFTFRVSQPNRDDTALGPEAQLMMDELREEAAKIKAELTAKREQERLDEAAQFPEGRKIAKAKGKAGRFSEVHMEEFKKMDSIANHPSVFRATPGRHTSVKSGVKRTQSKANLNEPESASRQGARSRPISRSPEKAVEEPESPTKRVRQRMEDDVSTIRPVSRDGSFIPRPKSSGNDSLRGGIPRSQTMGSLMTPTKASAARVGTTKTPTIAPFKSPSRSNLGHLATSPSKASPGGLTRSPSRPDLSSFPKSPSKPDLGGLKKAATLVSLNAAQGIPALVQTPGRFDRVKSILKRQFSASKTKSNIPKYGKSVPKTPGRTEKGPASVAMTTPNRKVAKHVDFTPDTKQAALTQNSPSPAKSVGPRSAATPKFSAPSYPSFDAVMSSSRVEDEVSYPDLSAYAAGTEKRSELKQPEPLPQSIPGTFSFRSDHTIRFNSASPKGFGAASGQASVRHIRPSFAPIIRMPGSFPSGAESSPNKENNDPAPISGIPHGIDNKKRHRAVWDDEEVKAGIPHGISNKKRHRASWEDEDAEDEGARRGAKKLRKHPPAAEGEALVAPRLASSSPIKKPVGVSGTPSPQKKKASLSLSRLNMLARPKYRK